LCRSSHNVPLRRERAERDVGDVDRLGEDLAGARERDPPDDLVRAAGQARHVLDRLGGVARLAEDRAAERHERIGAEDERAGDRKRLAARVLRRDRARLALGQLLDVARPDLERDARLLQDRPPLRRGRGEDQPCGKNRFASRSADSGESEPWTMFWPTSIAKSPRIEPATASSGLVAPIT
jgi:hypothetical protein